MAASGRTNARHLLHLYRSLPSHVRTRFLCRRYSRGQDESHHKPEIHPPGKLKTYLVKKYVGYVEGFENKFESSYPQVYKVYKLFKDGISDFFSDTKLYYSVATNIWGGRSLDTFSRQELEAYRQLPGEIMRVGPTVILLNIPVTDVLTPFLAYMFPRLLLCRHFWTPQQRIDFALHDLRQRLPCYPRILHSLERHSRDIRDVAKRKMFEDILLKLERDAHPEVEELLEIKDLFEGRPFGLKYAPKLQMWYVARSLDLSTFRHQRFMDEVHLLHNIDLAIHREGLDSLSFTDLQQTVFTRGLNAADADEEEMKDFLKKWTHLSCQVQESSLSLLLHAPVFLTFNRPANKKYLISEVDIRDKDTS